MNRRRFVKIFSSAAAGLAILPGKKIRASEKDSYTTAVPDPHSWKISDVNIAWIGHSTVLINLFGTTILTDPVLGNSIGIRFLGMTLGPHRLTPPALKFEQIPRPDIILLSHAHMDHMDYETLEQITGKYPNQIDCITAYNTADVISDLSWKSLTELDWNESYQINNTCFRALEVKHFGWRFPWERDRSRGYMMNGRSFNAYLIHKGERKILFGGDTAYSELFIPLKNEKIDAAIMPIGAYNPWRANHCTPEEALEMAAVHMEARNFIPIHCDTFSVSAEPVDEPLKRLKASAASYRIDLGLQEIGETFTLSGI